jgi:hypothetical protein
MQTEGERMALDVSLEQARALHRVWRALNDGDCPKCHHHFAASDMLRDWQTLIPRGRIGAIQCPSCKFHVSGPEIDEIEKLFAPAMDGAVAVFEEWRKSLTRADRD